MKTTLYLGTDPTQFESQGYFSGHLIHYPVIKIVPRVLNHVEIESAYCHLNEYTHLIFTSKNAVKVFFDHLAELKKDPEVIKDKVVIAIGSVTAIHLSMRGFSPQFTAQNETQEGLVELLSKMELKETYFFIPRSTLSRPVLVDFFNERQIRYQACDLYDTITQALEPKPDLNSVEEIVFTSPSTVKAFLEIFGVLPKQKKLIAIGPITERELLDLLRN